MFSAYSIRIFFLCLFEIFIRFLLPKHWIFSLLRHLEVASPTITIYKPRKRKLGPCGSKWRINFPDIFLSAEIRRFLYLYFPYFQKQQTMHRINCGHNGVNYSLSYANKIGKVFCILNFISGLNCNFLIDAYR